MKYDDRTDLFEFMRASKDAEDWNERIKAVKTYHQGWPAELLTSPIVIGSESR